MKNNISTFNFIKKATVFWLVIIVLHIIINFLTDNYVDLTIEGSVVSLIREINTTAIFLIICFIPIIVILFVLIKIAERFINKAAEKYNKNK